MYEGMSQRCRCALQKSRMELLDDLDVKPATDYLLSKLILSPEDSQRILAKQLDCDNKRELLDILPQRGHNAYDEFCKFLNRPTQEWLYGTVREIFGSITQSKNIKMRQRCFIPKLYTSITHIMHVYHYHWLHASLSIVTVDLDAFENAQHELGGGKSLFL